jgi:hypothetical protein
VLEKRHKIDVIINVCGKPLQTALTLLSLVRHSGPHIDKIYFIEENVHAQKKSIFRKSVNLSMDRNDLNPNAHAKLKLVLKDHIIQYTPKHWLWVKGADSGRTAIDEDYRLSVRYQYGFEKSDKNFVFITHNDCIYFEDILGALLDNIDENIAIGHVGQCWNCPASWAGKCTSDTYQTYKPDLEEIRQLYLYLATPPRLAKRDVFGVKRSWLSGWPLPECRVNEWCALINLQMARPVTQPSGSATMFGNYHAGNLVDHELGVGWFHDVCNLGFRVKHYPIYDHMKHTWGHPSMSDSSLYINLEEEAKVVLKEEYDFSI